MASITGSQFDATATQPSTTVNVQYTSDGTGLPPAIPGDFNLEVWTGSGTPSLASGYNGLLVDYNGQFGNLITGAFSLADTGSGGHFIQASADHQTVVGAWGDIIETQGANDSVTGNGNVILSYGNGTTANLATGSNTFFGLGGNNDTVLGGSGNSFAIFEGTGNTYTGGTGNDTVVANVGSTGNHINAGSGNDLIYSFGQNNTIQGGGGSDTVGIVTNNNDLIGGSGSLNAQVVGTGNTVTGGSGPDTVLLAGNGNTFTGGSGNDTLTAFGNSNTITGGAGPDTISVYGNTNSITFGAGADAVTVDGANDSVAAGTGSGSTLTFIVGSTHGTFVDNPANTTYSDTIVGFDNSAGDTIKLGGTDTAAYAVAHQSSQNGGADTLVTLNDGSTILLKGVSSVTTGFFS